jgi:hypothetical protein
MANFHCTAQGNVPFTAQEEIDWAAAQAAEAAARPARLRAEMIDAIDDRIAAIIQRNARFQAGHAKQEAAARAFVAAGYTGDPGPLVSNFAAAMNYTNTAAADGIIAKIDYLDWQVGALEAIRVKSPGINRGTLVEARALYAAIMQEITTLMSSN